MVRNAIPYGERLKMSGLKSLEFFFVAHIRRPYFMLQNITQFGGIRQGKNVCV